MKITEILTEQGMAKSDHKRGLDHAYEIYGNEHGYFVWRKSPLSKVLSVNHTDPEWSPSSDWTGFMDYSPRHPNIQDYVKTHMKPASFNSLPPNIKKNIVSQLPPKIPKDDSFRLPNWKDGTRPLSPWDYSEENPVTQRNMAIKQRLQSNPMAGPKSQLPEQGMAEGPGTVDINSIASELRFLPTTKQAKRYRFVANGQPGQMPAMSYTVSQQEQPVITVTADGKETQNVAAANDIIMSGPSRENYVVKAAKFPKLYQGQVGQTVIPEQSPRQVAQYRGRDTVTFTAPWGENMVLKPGDYLVRDGDQGYYRIAQAEYGQTYNPPGR